MNTQDLIKIEDDYFINTFIFTVITTALMLVIIVPAAFAFSRMEFRGKNLPFCKKTLAHFCEI